MNVTPTVTNVASRAIASPRTASSKSEQADSVALGTRPEPEICYPYRPGAGKFHQVDGLSHISTGSVKASDVDTPAERQALADQMAAYMQAWPSTKAVVTVVEGDSKQTSIVISERSNAVEQPVLEGTYEVVQRLASSDFIKAQAHKYPSSYHAIAPFDEAGKAKQLVLPGDLDTKDVEKALTEGRTVNQHEQLQDLVANLPQGERVVLLVGGPSAAGKSTLIRKLAEYAGERPLSVIEGDMYFKDVDQAGYPKTTEGTHYWDHPDFMDIDQLKKDLTKLLETGESNIPVYNFMDTPPGDKRKWAPEWRIPTTVTGFREDTPHHVEVADDSIIVLDSIHATHPEIVKYFEDKGLTYRNVYLDSPSSEDRLLRRIVRDYEKRGGRSVDESMDIWDLTTWRGEKEFIRPGILGLDPARDVALVLEFPNDIGLTREQIEAHGAAMEQFGISPSYDAFKTPIDELGAFARKEEARLTEVLSSDADEKAKATAQRELDALRAAPKYDSNAA